MVPFKMDLLIFIIDLLFIAENVHKTDLLWTWCLIIN